MVRASVLVALALTGHAALQNDFELCAAPATVQIGPNSTCASLGALATSTIDIAAVHRFGMANLRTRLPIASFIAHSGPVAIPAL